MGKREDWGGRKGVVGWGRERIGEEGKGRGGKEREDWGGNRIGEEGKGSGGKERGLERTGQRVKWG